MKPHCGTEFWQAQKKKNEQKFYCVWWCLLQIWRNSSWKQKNMLNSTFYWLVEVWGSGRHGLLWWTWPVSVGSCPFNTICRRSFSHLCWAYFTMKGSPVLLPLAAGGAFLKLHIWAGLQHLSEEEQSCCQSCLTCNSSGRFTSIFAPSDRNNSKLHILAKFLWLPVFVDVWF